MFSITFQHVNPVASTILPYSIKCPHSYLIFDDASERAGTVTY